MKMKEFVFKTRDPLTLKYIPIIRQIPTKIHILRLKWLTLTL
jgi:hypothetical protein